MRSFLYFKQKKDLLIAFEHKVFIFLLFSSGLVDHHLKVNGKMESGMD